MQRAALVLQDIGPSIENPEVNRIRIWMVKRNALVDPELIYSCHDNLWTALYFQAGHLESAVDILKHRAQMSAARFLGVDIARERYDSDSEFAYRPELFDSDTSIVRDYRLDGGAPLFFKQRIETQNYPGHFWQLHAEGTEGRVQTR